MIQTISDALLAKLQTLEGSGQPFVTVFDYHTIENSGYPYTWFELVEMTSDFLDSCTNNRDYIFDIFIFQEITEVGGRSEAVSIINNALDKVLLLIDQNYTLDGVLDRGIVPVNGTVTPFTLQNGPALVASLRVNCRTTEFIS